MFASARLQALLGTARADAARTFYGETLGLKLVSDDAFALVFAAADGEVRVAKVPAVMPAAYAVLSLIVDDVHAGARELAQKGVRLERFPFLQQDADGVWTAPDHTMVAWFRDPDGNLLSITQYPE
jgi:catechol 2,3-dioxygenase-like lactoylglutathione lyase family enzyme